MSLTDAAIRAAKPGDKTIKLFDGGGLYLEVAPSGGRWWRLKYRFQDREKRISLGTYPVVGLRDARERREQAKKLLAQNIDPSVHKQAEKEAVKRQQEAAEQTFKAVALQWWASDGFALCVLGVRGEHQFILIHAHFVARQAKLRPRRIRHSRCRQAHARGQGDTAHNPDALRRIRHGFGLHG